MSGFTQLFHSLEDSTALEILACRFSTVSSPSTAYASSDLTPYRVRSCSRHQEILDVLTIYFDQVMVPKPKKKASKAALKKNRSNQTTAKKVSEERQVPERDAPTTEASKSPSQTSNQLVDSAAPQKVRIRS